MLLLSLFVFHSILGDAGKQISKQSPLLWSFHHCFTDSNDAVFYSGRDSKESAETTGSIDDSGESEKLFSVSVYDKFLWMD